jgi:hypothetical protein
MILNIFSLFIILLVIYHLIRWEQFRTVPESDQSLKDLSNSISTGDLFLFRTDNSYDLPEFIFFRMLLTLLTNNNWSHIAMAVRCPQTNRLYLWESSETPSWDYLTNSMFSGIKLCSLSEKINSYDGKVAYRSLKKPLSEGTKRHIYALIQKLTGTPFKVNYLPTGNNQDQSKEIPTEINCASALQYLCSKIGLSIDSHLLLPATPSLFSTKNSVSNKYWKPEILVKS